MTSEALETWGVAWPRHQRGPWQGESQVWPQEVTAVTSVPAELAWAPAGKPGGDFVLGARASWGSGQGTLGVT